MEGKGLGEIVMCMMSCRHEGGKPGVDQPRIYRITSCNDAVFRMLQSQVFGQDITRRTSRFFIGHRPPHIYPHIYPHVYPHIYPHIYPHVYLTSCTWLFLPGLPSLFLHTASNQNWRQEHLGTRLLAPGQWGWCTTEPYWQHIGKTLLTTISCKVPFISFCFTIKLLIHASTAYSPSCHDPD